MAARPDLASSTGLFDSLAPMHRAAVGGHVEVLRAVVEALRTYGASIADPAKGDPKVVPVPAAPPPSSHPHPHPPHVHTCALRLMYKWPIENGHRS